MVIRLMICSLFFCSTKMVIAQNKISIQDTNDITYTRIEVDAEFPGGLGAWNLFLRKNLKSNVPLKNGASAGSYKVVVRFIIGKDGSINNVTAETNYGYGMENELMRVIKKGPKWKPATLNGAPLRAYRIQPITFVVTGK